MHYLTAETYCSHWPVTAGRRMQNLPISAWLIDRNVLAATTCECLHLGMVEVDALSALLDGEEVQ